MKKINYLELSNKIKTNNGLVRGINTLDKAITFITVVLYGGLVCYLMLMTSRGIEGASATLYKTLLVPGISFILFSIYRSKVNARRPYEVYDFEPAIKKDTKGKSFPSRHVFSIFIVAMAFLKVSIPIGILLFILGVLLGVLRVVGGVHFLRDVLAGGAIALIVGIICFFVMV